MKYRVLFLLFCLFSCKNKSGNSTIDIAFNADSTEIRVKDIPYADLQEFKKRADQDSTLTRGMMFVTEIPAIEDTATYERPVSGRIIIGNGTVSFKPNTAFEKGKTYQVESYIGVMFAKKIEIFKKSIPNVVRPNTVILKR